MQIDTLRPLSARKTGPATTQPSGGGNTIASVTADNNDATYIIYPVAGLGNWSVRMEPHTPAAGYQRHQIRGRIRARTDVGTLTDDIDIGRGTSDYIAFGQADITSTMTEYASGWFQQNAYNLADATITDFNMGGGYLGETDGGTTELRTAEVYLDVDCRQAPQYTPQARDASGADQTGGTITDTDQPVLWFGTPAYDSLSANAWSVSVVGAASGPVFSQSGFGMPPSSITMPSSADDDYTATFSVASTIRAADVFPNVQVITFELHNIIPPPSPPLLTVEREGDGYRLTWEDPGGQTWDDGYVITEVWRDDCTGSQRIAAVTDGLNGSYLDLAIPQLDENGLCGNTPTPCDITYRVRYWGYVSTTVTLPVTVPVELIIAWPGNVGMIPSGWLRVTALDGFHPRGATATGTPSATGGVVSHSHTTPNHQHRLDRHIHSFPGSTAGNNDSTTTQRFEGADRSLANQPHSHTLPASTGLSTLDAWTGLQAPGTNTVSNDPLTQEVIWIRSDGSATQFPVGALAWSAQNVSGWTANAPTSGRYLKGAAAAGSGGATFGANSHSHTVASHSHSGAVHDHPDFTTGVSGPAASTEGDVGGSGITPRWLGRHTHPGNVVSGPSSVAQTASGGTTGTVSNEPPYRLLRVLRNTSGGMQTRIIGLYTGDLAALPATLTACNGGNGTPDMRGRFARDLGTGSVNATGGATSHTHSVPNHGHAGGTHGHTVTIGQSESTTYSRDTSPTTGNVPLGTHVHTSGSVSAEPDFFTSNGAGTTGSASNLPVYREAHFVRLDGTIDGGSLPTPAQRVTEYAEITVPAVDFGQEYDRLSTLEGSSLAVATDRGHAYPRLVTNAIPLDGGVHTVSVTEPGEDVSLTIAVVGKDEIDSLEALLASDRVYWAPLGGEPGWFAPGGWSVSAPAPEVKVVTVTLVRTPWPDVPDPATLL